MHRRRKQTSSRLLETSYRRLLSFVCKYVCSSGQEASGRNYSCPWLDQFSLAFAIAIYECTAKDPLEDKHACVGNFRIASS